MNRRSQEIRIVSLLGAGASASCGLPTMTGFVDEWLELYGSPSRRPVDTSLGHWILRGWGHPGLAEPRYDLEGLLSILQDLSDLERPTGTSFGIELGIRSMHYPWVRARHALDSAGFKEKGTSPGRYRDWYSTDDPLRDFVLSFESNRNWAESYVPGEAGQLLAHLKGYLVKRLGDFSVDDAQRMFAPLLQFLRDSRGRARCFSLNYDLILEAAAAAAGWQVERGFSRLGRWRGLRTTSRSTPTLILGKLHGSLDWSIDNAEQPVVISGGEPRATSDPLIVYPIATKQWYRQPFFSLISDFGAQLERADALVVIGYSFRDEAIGSVISQACSRNDRLTVVVVNPSLTHTQVQDRIGARRASQTHALQARWEGGSTVDLIREVLSDYQ